MKRRFVLSCTLKIQEVTEGPYSNVSIVDREISLTVPENGKPENFFYNLVEREREAAEETFKEYEKLRRQPLSDLVPQPSIGEHESNVAPHPLSKHDKPF